MDDYGTVVYLDVQKTGSTYISDFLAKVLPHRSRNFRKHARLDRQLGPDTLILSSVRHPVEQWRSLYQFGAGSRTTPIRRALEAVTGRPFTYDGSLDDFLRWIDFVLDPANARALSPAYAGAAPELIGFQSFRFLRLNLACRPMRLGRCADRDAIRRLAETQLHPAAIIRTEALHEDLAAVARDRIGERAAPEAEIEKVLATLAPVRVARRKDFATADIPTAVQHRIREREWFLMERFYPGG